MIDSTFLRSRAGRDRLHFLRARLPLRGLLGEAPLHLRILSFELVLNLPAQALLLVRGAGLFFALALPFFGRQRGLVRQAFCAAS